MAKKERREVPVEELSEEEVRRWFVRLRELLREQRHLIHNRKIERGELKLRITQLEHEKSVLRKENEKLKATKEKKKEKVDFKKNFFDRL